MKHATIFLAVAALTFAFTANASLTSVTYTNDGDGAINCVYNPDKGHLGSDAMVCATGDQFWAPGHMLGYFVTDSTLDPTLTLETTVGNDTVDTWTDYHVNVMMPNSFSISSAQVNTPGDWTSSFIAPAWNGTEYVGQVNFLSGTGIAPGDSLDFQYKISFSGSMSYSFCQEMMYSVPEPGSLALLGLGGLLLGASRLRRRS